MKIKDLFLLPGLLYLLQVNAIGQTASSKVLPIYNAEIGVIREMPLKSPGVKGSVYLNEHWVEADIDLKGLNDSDLKSIPIKIDLKDNIIEILTDQGVKVLPLNRVDRIEWLGNLGVKEVFINANDLNIEGVKLKGVYQLISLGDVMLVERNHIKIIKADYNVALSVGSKDDRLVKMTELFFVKNKKLISVNKRTLFDVMHDKEDLVKQFIKNKRLKINNDYHLRMITDYYNSL